MTSCPSITIAYDPQIWSFQAYGGISRYFREIAIRIATLESARVAIVAPVHVNEYLDERTRGLVRGIQLGDRQFGLGPRRALSMLLGHLLLYKIAPDIIHETFFSPFRTGPRRARRVVTIHDMIHEKYPKHFPGNSHIARNKAIAARRADHIICVSEATRRDVTELLGIAIGKTSVIHHGCSLSMPADAASMKSEAISSDYLLYVGSRRGYKNFAALLTAFARSSHLRNNFRLVCFGGGDFDESERAAVTELGFSDNEIVHVSGNDDHLQQYYRRAAALVYPSLYEGFGLPPLEAMSNDCVVICSAAGSIPEVVGDAGAYFDPTSPEDIAETVERVLRSEVLQRELVGKGRARINAFSWDRCASQTFEAYQRLR